MKFDARFKFGDRVILDGDKHLVARVVAFTFRSEFSQIEIAWMHNGTHYTAWVDNWRLELAP